MSPREIKISKICGFCFGVERAVNLTLSALKNKKKTDKMCVWSLGEIIHNPQVIKELKYRGLKLTKSLNSLKKGDILIIRSHGESPTIIKEAKKRKLKIIDTTCPLVKNVQQIASSLKKRGFEIIIMGDKRHPEVRALKNIVGKKAKVISAFKETKKLKLRKKKIGLIEQTTQSLSDFKKIASYVSNLDYRQLHIFNTICEATITRQKLAVEIARKVDIMFVIGGKQSANTKRLAEICSATGTPTKRIEEAGQIKESWLERKGKIGVTSGTSTPSWVIEEVVKSLRFRG
jgi:4-hydroxy-3-methylbut-2-enyl diphosphate reductase